VQFAGNSCLQQAIRHMDVNDRDVDGDTPLHNAIHFRNAAAIKFLIRNGADIHLKDFEGRNAIDLANVLGYRRLYEFLCALERETERLGEAVDSNDTVGVSNSLLRGASLGMRDLRLDTPLHRAAESGVTDVGRLLVHHGAALEARNYLGETPLLVAMLREQPEFARMLIEAGANVNALDERRRTPLDIAESKGNDLLVAMLQRKKARHGAAESAAFDLDAVNGEVETTSMK
jgi:ankyrin repeat protein